MNEILNNSVNTINIILVHIIINLDKSERMRNKLYIDLYEK